MLTGVLETTWIVSDKYSYCSLTRLCSCAHKVWMWPKQMSMHCSQSCSLQNSWISFRLEKGQSSGKHQSHQSVSAAANATVNWNCLLLRLLSKVLWGLLLPSYWVDLSLPPVTGQPGAFLQAGYYPRPGIQFPASEGDISHAMLPSVQSLNHFGRKKCGPNNVCQSPVACKVLNAY